MAELIPSDLDLLHGRNFGHFVTLNEDGTAQSTPVWVDAAEGFVLVNTAAGRKKDRNAQRDPRVALSIHDRGNPYRWLSMQGTVVERILGPQAETHIDTLARRYTGSPWTPYPGQERVLYRIRPDRVVRSAN